MERTIDVRGGHLDSSLNCSVISGLVALSENERSVAPECEMKWACTPEGPQSLPPAGLGLQLLVMGSTKVGHG